MNNNQQNPNWNQNNQDRNQDRNQAAMPNDPNPQNQNNIPGMPNANMGFQPGIMPYGMPHFMSQLQMGGVPPQQMPQHMYPGQNMMPNTGAEQQPRQQVQEENSVKLTENNQKDLSKDRQNDANENQIEKRESKEEGGEGKSIDDNAIGNSQQEDIQKQQDRVRNQEIENAKDNQNPNLIQNQAQALNQAQNQAQIQAQNQNQAQNQEHDEDDEDVKYNLRKRSRKENPYYY
jgi:hypothetical protein